MKIGLSHGNNQKAASGLLSLVRRADDFRSSSEGEREGHLPVRKV
jgi:hypothetical protein